MKKQSRHLTLPLLGRLLCFILKLEQLNNFMRKVMGMGPSTLARLKKGSCSTRSSTCASSSPST
ncbi:MAG: hypothetical protein IJ511_06085 [Bacteroides sp.]|nr:hypothetical protein [Bacteroides sp.]